MSSRSYLLAALAALTGPGAFAADVASSPSEEALTAEHTAEETTGAAPASSAEEVPNATGAPDAAEAPSAGEAPDDAGQVEAVTVSARRVSEDVQDVPIPIAVLSGDALEGSGRFRLEDLNQALPSTNVQFGNPRQTSIAVRGLGNNPANDALESSVGVYLDNVYLGRPGMANLDLIDIDQVALLRGPQGTLFGKNTTAGVLNLQTRLPTFRPEYDFEASGGDYGYNRVRASASGPVFGDVLAGRISAAHSREAGFIHDITDGRRLNGFDRDGVRGQLLFKPGDAFSLRLIGDYNRESSDCCVSVLYNAGPNGGALYYALVNRVGATVVLDPRYQTTTYDAAQHMAVNQGGVSAEANWQVHGLTLTSISAYRNWRFTPTNDGDGLDLNAITNAGQGVDDEQWTQELRIATPVGGVFQSVAGLYYFYQHQANQQYTYYGPDAAAYTGRAFFDNASTTVNQWLTTNSVAAFAQTTWKATDRWSFTGGVRETYEDKYTRIRRNPAEGPAAFQAAFGPFESGKLGRHDSNVSALVSSSYKLSDGVLGYASLARGAKAGGINPIVPTGGLSTASLYVSPEKAMDYEVGVKSSSFERRLQVNANLFWVDVTDYQATQLLETSPGVTVQELTNIGKVRSRGVELEVQAVPVTGVHLSLSSSYNDAVYRSYADAPCAAEQIAAGRRVCDLSGSPVTGAPKWIVNPGIEVEHTIGLFGLRAFGGADYAWRSSFFGSADDSELAKVEAYGLLNLRAGLSAEAGQNHWSAWVWADNATNKAYVLGGLQLPPATLQYTEFPGQPRTIGASVRVDF